MSQRILKLRYVIGMFFVASVPVYVLAEEDQRLVMDGVIDVQAQYVRHAEEGFWLIQERTSLFNSQYFSRAGSMTFVVRGHATLVSSEPGGLLTFHCTVRPPGRELDEEELEDLMSHDDSRLLMDDTVGALMGDGWKTKDVQLRRELDGVSIYDVNLSYNGVQYGSGLVRIRIEVDRFVGVVTSVSVPPSGVHDLAKTGTPLNENQLRSTAIALYQAVARMERARILISGLRLIVPRFERMRNEMSDYHKECSESLQSILVYAMVVISQDRSGRSRTVFIDALSGMPIAINIVNRGARSFGSPVADESNLEDQRESSKQAHVTRVDLGEPFCRFLGGQAQSVSSGIDKSMPTDEFVLLVSDDGLETFQFDRTRSLLWVKGSEEADGGWAVSESLKRKIITLVKNSKSMAGFGNQRKVKK